MVCVYSTCTYQGWWGFESFLSPSRVDIFHQILIQSRILITCTAASKDTGNMTSRALLHCHIQSPVECSVQCIKCIVLTLPAPASSCIAFHFGYQGNHGILSNPCIHGLFLMRSLKLASFHIHTWLLVFTEGVFSRGSVSVLVGQCRTDLNNIWRFTWES